MRVVPLGENAWLLKELELSPAEAARRLSVSSQFNDVVACYDTVGVYFESAPDLGELERLLSHPASISGPRHHQIPVCYERGDDLALAAQTLGISPEALIHAHTGKVYDCYAVGFCPGFPYLGYLDSSIAGLPRLARPRVRVPAGSVAITGRQTGIYPLERPGGWWLLGQTPLSLVDVEESYFPITSGDTVQFVSISLAEFVTLQGERL